MALVSPQIHLSKWLVLMVSITSMISHGHARARIHISNKVSGFDKPKGAIKTIESHETGEVIDCVDIFKQPAFDHPLLKNHTIQMKPSSNPKANGSGDAKGAFSQPWWKYGECPEGTIPILRTQNHTNRRYISPSMPNVKLLNRSGNYLPILGRHEEAVASLVGGCYKGGRAQINVWNPTVMDLENSLSQIWITAGPTEWMNTVEAGVMVSTISDPKHEAKVFIYWTSDGYGETGCYNLDCAGFVQTGRGIALGARIGPVSTYNGAQFAVNVEITRNDFTGWWWLRIADIDVGYWPWEIFTSLKCPATRVEWGGEILNKAPRGVHTSTQMGSGHFPSEGFGKASFFRHLRYWDEDRVERDPENLATKVTRPECYDLRLNVDPVNIAGVNLYYGGPGFSAQCP